MPTLRDITSQYGVPLAVVVALLYGGAQLLRGLYREGELGRAAITDLKHEMQLMRRDMQEVIRRVDGGVAMSQSNAWIAQFRAGLRSVAIRLPDGVLLEVGKQIAEVVPDLR